MTDGWPVDVDARVESVVTTSTDGGRWAVAALGLRPGDPVTARTWGATRTRGNFHRVGTGVVQFVRDPVWFVDAALAAMTVETPVLEVANAWVEVAVEPVEEGSEAGTSWVDWALTPVEVTVDRESVPTIQRGLAAVVEATVAASRLDVPAFDDAALRAELSRHRSVVERCGGPRDRQAMRRLHELVDG